MKARQEGGTAYNGGGEGNEGQKMVWHLQDMQKHIDAEEIEAPMLLPGISMTSEIEERKKNRRLYKPDELADKFLNEDEEGPGLDTKKAFQEHQNKARQIVFREREVDNLISMIYSNTDAQTDVDMAGEDYEEEDEGVIDTYRYDVAPEKLSMYKLGSVKRKLKSKFVTGQSSDQIVQNLLNMSDSEGE